MYLQGHDVSNHKESIGIIHICATAKSTNTEHAKRQWKHRRSYKNNQGTRIVAKRHLQSDCLG